jgi:hypothetical protein
MMEIQLLAEHTLAAKEAAFDAACARLPSCYNEALLADPVTGRCLKFYLLLTHLLELLDDPPLSPEQVFWNRYYWLARYMQLRLALHGPDAGLEQQLAQVLEYPYPPCDPDWSLLEPVEAAAERDAAAQLASQQRVPGRHSPRRR